MPRLVEQPTIVSAAGTQPKQIQEFVGRVNTGDAGVSVARMVSPEGWREPGQQPEFEEVTLVLSGLLRVEHKAGQLDVLGRTGDRDESRRMGPLQHPGAGRSRVRRYLLASVLARIGTPRSRGIGQPDTHLGHDYLRCLPPSTRIVSPVTKSDSSRDTTALTTS